MKRITESRNGRWPRRRFDKLLLRRRDLVVRIADWTGPRSQPRAYDVELYIGGIYDWHESRTFKIEVSGGKEQAWEEAVRFASKQIRKLL